MSQNIVILYQDCLKHGPEVKVDTILGVTKRMASGYQVGDYVPSMALLLQCLDVNSKRFVL